MARPMCGACRRSPNTLSTASLATSGSPASCATALGFTSRFNKAELLANLFVRNEEAGFVLAPTLLDLRTPVRMVLHELERSDPAVEVLLVHQQHGLSTWTLDPIERPRRLDVLRDLLGVLRELRHRDRL